MRPIYKTMAPDGDVGGAGGGMPVPEAAPVAEPAPEPVAAQPPQAAAPEQFDYRTGFEQLATVMKESQAAHQAELQRIRELFHQTFDPQGYAKTKEPRYATVEQIQGALSKTREEILTEQRTERLIAKFQDELGAAREKYADLFEAYPGAEAAIREEWAKSKTGESVVSIAKRFDAALSKAWDARQKKYMAEKQIQGEQTKTTVKGGTPVKPNGAESTARGFGRIREALRKHSASTD